MNDPDFQHLLQQARLAQARLDFSAREFGFETRVGARLAGMGRRGPGPLQLLWQAVGGCAAMVGVVAVWFILAQAPRAAEDDLAAFWDSGQSVFDAAILLN